MFRGAFSGFLFYKVGGICAVLSLISIYWISQYLKHDPPFPSHTISRVAQHYPQFIIFRIGTITGACLIVLGWMTNYFVLKTICVEHGVNLKAYHPKIPLKAGVMGGLLLMMSTACIDTGHMFELLHDVCATSFFIVTFFAQIYNTVIVIKIQKICKAFSQSNIYFKYVLLAVLAVQLFFNFAPSVLSQYDETAGGLEVRDNKSNFYEWTLTTTIISMFMSIGLDAGRFDLVYQLNE